MRKKIAIGLISCMILSLAACGNAEVGETAAKGSEEEQASKVIKETQKVGSGEKVKVKIQSWQYALGNYKGLIEDDEIAAAIEEAFNSTHDDIELEVSLLRQEDHFNALRVDISAGTAPDVIGITPGAVLEQFKTQLLPLNSYASDTWGEAWQDRFTEAALTTIKMSGEDIYALPSAMSAAGTIWTAEEQLKAGGVDSIPATWDELKAAAATLRENGSIPLMFGGKDPWQNYDVFITLLGTLNKDLANDVFAGKADWNQPDVIKAFEYFEELYTEGIVQDGALTTTIYNEGIGLWKADDGTGNVPMIFTGSWELGGLSDINSFYETYSARGIQVAKLPSIEGKESVVLSAPDVAWSVPSSSENPEAAWEVVRWLTDDMQSAVVDGLGFFSVLKDPPEVTATMTDEFKKSYDVISEAISSDNTLGFREAFDASVGNALFDNLQLLATGGTTPEEAAKAMDAGK